MIPADPLLMPPAPSTPRRRSPRIRATLATAGVVAALLPVVAVAPPAQARMAVPATRALPAQVDAYAGYQGQQVCSPTPKAGALRLAALLRTTYGRSTIGISRACSIGGQSEHKEGRALDWMMSMRVPGQRARVNAFLAWLLKPDAQGRPAEMARRLGVMYLGWDDHFWAAYRPDAGWTDLKGCSTDPRKQARGYDTYCHRNHLHISLSWEGAAGLTSFWTGVPLAPACDSGWGGGADAPAGTGVDLVPVAPVRVLDTFTGTGLTAPCRLTAPDGWDGASRDVVVRVTGVGAVPADGVAAVAVRVTAYRTASPAVTVSLRATATSPWVPATTSPATTSSTTVVPVATDGTVRVGVDAGSTDVRLDVVGWVPLVAPPSPPTSDPSPPTDPGPTPSPTGDPSAGPTTSPSPDPSTSPAPTSSPASLTTSSAGPSPSASTGPTAPVAGGRTHLVRPTVVYDGAASPLRPGETRTVRLAGVGPLPTSGLSGLALTVTAGPTRGVTTVVVLAPGSSTYVGTLRTAARGAQATQAVVPTSDGTVVLRNAGTVPVAVRLTLAAWFSSAPTTDGSTLTMLPTPVTVVDTRARVGLAGPVRSAAARLVRVTGAAAGAGAGAAAVAGAGLGSVPAGARGVLVSVSVLGGRTAGTLTLGSVAPTPAASFAAGQWAHEVVLLPLSWTGMLAVSTPSLGSQVRLQVLGYVT